MRSKLFTTVLALVIVGPFAYFVFTEAVQIKQHIQKQHSQLRLLNTKSANLDVKLVETKTVKDQTTQELHALQQQANDAVSERKKLETELGAD